MAMLSFRALFLLRKARLGNALNRQAENRIFELSMNCFSLFYGIHFYFQIRMIVNLPMTSRHAWQNLIPTYERLRNLSKLGFSLIKTLQNLDKTYKIEGVTETFSTEYELVWVNTEMLNT